jgi:hypothetical protein
LRAKSVWRRRILLILTFAAVASAALAKPPAEEGPWRYLLGRTLRDEQGLTHETLYIGDLRSRTLEAVFEFEPGFVIYAVIPNPTWEYALVTGRTYRTAEEVLRFYKVPLIPCGELEVLFEDGFRRYDGAIIVPAPEGDVFFLRRRFSVLAGEGEEPESRTVFYRYAPETGVEELAELEGYVALHGLAGQNKLYVSYNERLPEGVTTVYGYYDLVTGELTPSGFEPPDRQWSPGCAPLGSPLPGEGPLDYILGVVKSDSGYGIDFYIRESHDPSNYRRVIVEDTTAEFVLCRDRGVIVYIPELDVEDNGIRIVTKYLDGTYGEPFPLPSDAAGSDSHGLRRGYELFYVEGEAPRGLVGIDSKPPAWKSRSVYQKTGG